MEIKKYGLTSGSSVYETTLTGKYYLISDIAPIIEAVEFIHEQLKDKDSETVGWKDYLLIKAKTISALTPQKEAKE